jgi:hypothetical protein
MYYSYIRNYLDLDQADRILNIIKQKYKYGIYIDNYTVNMLMNHYLTEKNYKNAAYAAHELMLEELNTNDLSMLAAAYCCLKYLDVSKYTSGQFIEQYNKAEKEDKKKDNKDENEDEGEKVLFQLVFIIFLVFIISLVLITEKSFGLLFAQRLL